MGYHDVEEVLLAVTEEVFDAVVAVEEESFLVLIC